MAHPKDRAMKKASPDTTAAVDAFMATLEHPDTVAMAAISEVMRRADPSV